MDSIVIGIIKKQFLKKILSNLSGIKYHIAYALLSHLFDKYLEPILKNEIKEGVIRINIIKLKEKLKDFHDAKTIDDIVDRFSELP